MLIIFIDLFGWFDPIGWLGNLIRNSFDTCCGLMFLLGSIVSIVLFLYIKKKKVYRLICFFTELKKISRSYGFLI